MRSRSASRCSGRTGTRGDTCVACSAVDARAGFEAFIVEDACRAIDTGASLAAAWMRMQACGVVRVSSPELGA